MAHEDRGHLEVEDRGAVLVVRVDGGQHGLFGLDIAAQLDDLIDRADADPDIHAVVFTGARPDRFVSHADVRWLQEGGAEVPAVGRRGAAAIIDTSHKVSKARSLDSMARKTPLWGGVQVDRLHETFLNMNRSGVIYVAAINGSTLGLGAEFAWACDLRIMAAGDYFIGPIVIAGWIQEVHGERLAAQRELARNEPSEPLSKKELCSLVRGVRDAVKMLAKADPALKAEVYSGLGLRLEYSPEERLVKVEAPLDAACTTARVGGGT